MKPKIKISFIKKSIKNGLSEAAFFIVAPLPGSKIEINKIIKEGEKNI